MTGNRMKKFFQYLLLIVLFSIFGIILTNKESFQKEAQKLRRQYIDRPCSKPIAYSIGTIDSRFNVSQDDLLSIINQAEQIWENPMGKNLFQYNPASQFKINLIYDDRQQTTQEAKSMENQLNSLELTHDQAEKDYASSSAVSKKKIDDYNKAIADYKDQLDKYNKEVEYWNKQGGAPEDEFNKLKKEKKDLDNIFSQLESQRKDINALVNKTNSLAQKSNQIAQNYNSNLNSYRNKFGEAREFDKGVYDGNSINIYQFNDMSDLRLALAHEAGHALGIDHLAQPESIMYYMMGEQDLENPKASDEDLGALKNICNVK
jgi:DNA repair exonuclease SbcCD ATPase subunit